MKGISHILSHAYTSCTGVAFNILCYILRSSKTVPASISDQGSSFYSIYSVSLECFCFGGDWVDAKILSLGNKNYTATFLVKSSVQYSNIYQQNLKMLSNVPQIGTLFFMH